MKNKLINIITQILNVRFPELRALLWLYAFSFFIGLLSIFFESAASALFLTKWGVSTIPYAYIGGAVIISFIGYLYSYFEQKLNFTKLITFTMLFVIVSLCIFRIIFYFTISKWPVMILFIWIEVFAILMSLVFWSLAGKIFNVRQGKRLFGLIGTGAIVAQVIGGFSISKIVKLVGTSNLLFISITSSGVCLFLLLNITQKFSNKINIKDDEDEDEPSLSIKNMFTNRYLLLLSLICIVSVFGFYFIDYAFFERIEFRYSSEEKIAGFLGIFFAVSGIINIIFKTFISGRLLDRFGMTAGLFGLPFVMTIGITGMILTGVIPTWLGLFFWLVVATRMFDEIVRNSIEEPSVLVLYQPLPFSIRVGAQTNVESIIEPIAGGIAGAMLLALGFFIELTALQLAFIFLIILMVWYIIAAILRKEYPKALEQALAKRTLKGGTLSIADKSSIEILLKGLSSNHIGEIIYVLNLLDQIDHKSINKILIDLLENTNPYIRIEALKRIEKRRVIEASEIIDNLIIKDKSPEVKKTAIITLCSLGGEQILNKISMYIKSKNTFIRQGAIIGLLRNGGIEGALIAGEILMDLVESSNPKNRCLAGNILGEVGIKSFYRPLLTLLNDNFSEVKRAAINAAGKLQNPKLWKYIAKHLSNPEVRNSATAAFIKGGNSSLDSLEILFNKDTTPSNIKKRIIRIYGQIGGDKAKGLLANKIDYPDNSIQKRIFASLELTKYEVPDNKSDKIKELIKNEVKYSVKILEALNDILNKKNLFILINALEYELKQKYENIFHLLTFIYTYKSIDKIRNNFNTEFSEKKAYAIEMIDNLISQDIKEILIPLLDDLTLPEKLKNLKSKFPCSTMSKADRILDLCSTKTWQVPDWIQICCLFLIGKLGLKAGLDIVIDKLHEQNSIIRETAIWAIGKLNPPNLIDILINLTKDPSSIVSKTAWEVIENSGMTRITKSSITNYSGKSQLELFANIIKNPNERYLRRGRAALNLGKVKSPHTKEYLIELLSINDEIILSNILKSLVNNKVKIKDNDLKTDLIKLLDNELSDIKKTISYILIFQTDKKYSDMKILLSKELIKNKERIISILELLNDNYIYNKLYYWFMSTDTKTEIPEYIMNLTSDSLSIIRNSNSEKALQKFLTANNDIAILKTIWQFDDNILDENKIRTLQEIADINSNNIRLFTKISAVKLLAENNIQKIKPQLPVMLQHPEPIVRETALWIIFKYLPDMYSEYKKEISKDKSPIINRILKNFMEDK